jgi:transcriptional antiterminator NusG
MDTFVPLKNVVKYVRGKKIKVSQKVFPNYVFIRMKMDSNAYDIIRGIPKVLNFLGSDPKKPEIVPEEKIEQLKKQIEEENNDESADVYRFGDMVSITSGSFESFTGTVESFDIEKNMLKVSVLVFNRPTIIDVDSNSVEKI